MKTIKSERIRLGLTQSQLATITGIPFRTIQNWEGGQRKCPDYVEKLILEKLAATFDQPDHKADLEDLLDCLEHDLKYLQTEEARYYVTNLIADVKEMS